MRVTQGLLLPTWLSEAPHQHLVSVLSVGRHWPWVFPLCHLGSTSLHFCDRNYYFDLQFCDYKYIVIWRKTLTTGALRHELEVLSPFKSSESMLRRLNAVLHRVHVVGTEPLHFSFETQHKNDGVLHADWGVKPPLVVKWGMQLAARTSHLKWMWVNILLWFKPQLTSEILINEDSRR